MPETTSGGLRLLSALAAFAALLIWVTTINGAGLQPDSIHYIRAARALGDGESLFAISKHWPPLYPLLLALFSPEVGAELGTARWLAILSFVATIAGLGACLRHTIRGPYAGYLIASALLMVMLSPGFTRVSWVALTEGPFLACLMWALFSLLMLTERFRLWALVLLCVCVAAMLLLRYSAAPFVLAMMMTLTYAALQWTWKQRTLVLAGVVLAFLPFTAWVLLHQSEGAPRHLIFHPPNAGHWIQFADTMGAWLGGMPALLTYLLIPLSLAAAAVVWWKQRTPALLFCLLIIPGYLAFLLLSISFMDAHTPLDTRILAPLLPLWILMIAIAIPALAREGARERTRIMTTAGLVLVTAVGAPVFARQAETAILYGVVFADRRAGEQAIIRYASRIDDDRAIYTNYNEWLYLLHNRDARILPHLYNPVKNALNPNLDTDMDAMLVDLASTDGVVIWVEFIKGRHYLPDLAFLTDQLGLEIVEDMQGGKVLMLRNDRARIPAPTAPRDAAPDTGAPEAPTSPQPLS